MGFYNWLGIDSSNFSLDPASTGTVIARLAIAFSGTVILHVAVHVRMSFR